MAGKRRALIIGGSMSGLLAGIMLSRRGWDVDIFERVANELAGRGAGIVAQAELIARMKGLGLDTRDLGVAMTTRKILDRAGADHAHARMPPGAYRLGARLPPAARCLRAGALPPQYRIAGIRAERGGRRRAFERRQYGRGRCADRRRRPALDGAPAMRARRGAALRRLRGVAGAASRKASSRRRSTANCSWI